MARKVETALNDAFFSETGRRYVYQVQRETPCHRRAQELAINGYKVREIAEALGRSPSSVSNILYQPWAREQMAERMKETANEEIKRLLEEAAPEAIQRVVNLAENSQGTELGFKADKEILDRFLGRPVQPMTTDVRDLDKLSDAELEKIARGGITATLDPASPVEEKE